MSMFRKMVTVIGLLAIGGLGSLELHAADEKLLVPAVDEQFLQSLPQKPLAAYQGELLDTAFDCATAMPVFPHIKSRSRQQQLVVEAALKLEQPRRAAAYARQIANWRAGAAYGDLAIYAAERGITAGVDDLLKLAEEIAKLADQDWRKGTVLAKVAHARTLLGQLEAARRLEAKLEDAEKGAVAMAQAGVRDDASFAEQMKHLDGMVAGGHFDVVKNVLAVYAELYQTYHADAERRQQIEQKLRDSMKGMPLFMQIDALLGLAEASLDRGQPAQGLHFVKEARAMVDSAAWPTDYYIPLLGKVAKMRARCGDTEAARREADEAMSVFDAEHASIQNFEQAGAIRPVAEAYRLSGADDKAMETYRRAIAVGSVNPNARCRSEDLTGTCLSMAVYQAEPDPELWKRIREIQKGLGDPW